MIELERIHGYACGIDAVDHLLDSNCSSLHSPQKPIWFGQNKLRAVKPLSRHLRMSQAQCRSSMNIPFPLAENL